MSDLLLSIAGTLAASTAAALLAVRLRLPGGAIVWAIAAAAAIHTTWPQLAPLPVGFRIAAQILVGTILGCSVTRSPLRRLWQARWPVTWFTVTLVSICLVTAGVVAFFTPLDLPTAAFAVAPGGATDMATASLHFGVDGVLVASVQVMRQILVFALVPALLAMTFPAPGEENRP